MEIDRLIRAQIPELGMKRIRNRHTERDSATTTCRNSKWNTNGKFKYMLRLKDPCLFKMCFYVELRLLMYLWWFKLIFYLNCGYGVFRWIRYFSYINCLWPLDIKTLAKIQKGILSGFVCDYIALQLGKMLCASHKARVKSYEKYWIHRKTP